MPAAARQVLEDAVLTRLRERLSRSGNPTTGYLVRVEPYNGEVGTASAGDDFRRALLGAAPGALVTTTSGLFTGGSVRKRRFQRQVIVEVYLISTHLRAREHRLRRDVVAAADATADPGIYRMLEDVFSVLVGDDLGVANAAPLRPLREDVLLQLPDLTAWRIQFSTELHSVADDLALEDESTWEEYAIDANIPEVEDAPNPIVEADGDLSE